VYWVYYLCRSQCPRFPNKNLQASYLGLDAAVKTHPSEIAKLMPKVSGARALVMMFLPERRGIFHDLKQSIDELCSVLRGASGVQEAVDGPPATFDIKDALRNVLGAILPVAGVERAKKYFLWGDFGPWSPTAHWDEMAHPMIFHEMLPGMLESSLIMAEHVGARRDLGASESELRDARREALREARGEGREIARAKLMIFWERTMKRREPPVNAALQELVIREANVWMPSFLGIPLSFVEDEVVRLLFLTGLVIPDEMLHRLDEAELDFLVATEAAHVEEQKLADEVAAKLDNSAMPESDTPEGWTSDTPVTASVTISAVGETAETAGAVQAAAAAGAAGSAAHRDALDVTGESSTGEPAPSTFSWPLNSVKTFGDLIYGPLAALVGGVDAAGAELDTRAGTGRARAAERAVECVLGEDRTRQRVEGILAEMKRSVETYLNALAECAQLVLLVSFSYTMAMQDAELNPGRHETLERSEYENVEVLGSAFFDSQHNDGLRTLLTTVLVFVREMIVSIAVPSFEGFKLAVVAQVLHQPLAVAPASEGISNP